mgnify:CR=1 FL=1
MSENRTVSGTPLSESTIKGLANFYNGFTKFLFFVFVIGCATGVIMLLSELSEYRPDLPDILASASILGFSLLGIIAVGATAVLLDIMHNIRSMNRNQKASDD